MALVKRIVLGLVVVTASIMAWVNIDRFVVEEVPFIQHDRREAKAQQQSKTDQEQHSKALRRAMHSVELLGARSIGSKGPQLVFDLSLWHGSHRDLLNLANVHRVTTEWFAGGFPLHIVSSNPRFDDDSVHYLVRIPNIVELNLADTQVTDRGLLELQGLQGSLRSLDLNRTTITDTGLRELRAFQKTMYSLSLSGTSVTDEGLANLEGFENLVVLRLAGTQICGTGLKSLSKSWKLRNLSLKASRANDDALKNLPTFTNLTCLNLEETAVTDAGLTQLTRLVALRWLYVKGTRVTPVGFGALRKSIPSLEALSNLSRGPHFACGND